MGAPTPPDALLQGISSPTKRQEAALSRRFSFCMEENGRSRNALVGCWRSLETHSMLPAKLGGI